MSDLYIGEFEEGAVRAGRSGQRRLNEGGDAEQVLQAWGCEEEMASRSVKQLEHR